MLDNHLKKNKKTINCPLTLFINLKNNYFPIVDQKAAFDTLIKKKKIK